MKPESQANLLKELEKYLLAINAIRKTRWAGQGISDTKTHTILYSGMAKITGESSIIDFQEINQRL